MLQGCAALGGKDASPKITKIKTIGWPWRALRMERALTHKYQVGESVYFTASNVARPAASGTYEIIKLLPTDGDDCQYRIKNSTEAFERVARESQLEVQR
jgi:hypothetical protein